MERVDIYFIVISIIIIYAIRSYNKAKTSESALTQYSLNLAAPLHEDMAPILDNMITKALDEYRVLNLGYKNEYINEKQEQEIVNAVKDSISNRISPVFMDRLSLQYNKDALPDVIAKKIILHVTAFVVENNSNQNTLPNETIKG